jgi:hypothetical protein
VILEAAMEFRSSKDVKNANHWCDEERKRAIQEKNKARGKCLIKKTRINLDISKKRTKANRICRKRKKEWIKEIKEINRTNEKRDKRKYSKDVRNLSSLTTAMTLVCRDKDGNKKKKKNKYWKDGNNTLKNYKILRLK